MKTFLPLILLVMSAVGCAAGPLVRLEEEERTRIAAAPPAVLVTVPLKHVHLSEFIYKVFWNETKVSTYSIDGIWDPAPVLEQTMAESLTARFGMESKSLRAMLGENTAAPLAESRERALKTAAVDGWIHSFPFEPAGKDLRALKSSGVEYLLEIGLLDIVVNRHSWGILRFQINVYGRLTRQSDGAVVWFDKGMSSVLIEGMNSFAELEKNDLARMKRHFADAAKALGAPGNPFLEVFAPRP